MKFKNSFNVSLFIVFEESFQRTRLKSYTLKTFSLATKQMLRTFVTVNNLNQVKCQAVPHTVSVIVSKRCKTLSRFVLRGESLHRLRRFVPRGQVHRVLVLLCYPVSISLEVGWMVRKTILRRIGRLMLLVLEDNF